MRLLALLVVSAVAVTSCSAGDDAQGSSDAYELSCEIFVSIHGDPVESFQGYATQQEAIESWILGTPSGPPEGEWVRHEANKWILVDEDGKTVARTEVRVMTGNANTTFTTDRYSSNEIEYCE